MRIACRLNWLALSALFVGVLGMGLTMSGCSQPSDKGKAPPQTKQQETPPQASTKPKEPGTEPAAKPAAAEPKVPLGLPPLPVPQDNPTTAEKVEPGNVLITNSIGMKMVLIPAGEFMMGSPEGEGGTLERPQHRVRITKPFYLGVYEVTQEQYEKVMGANPSEFLGPTRPVERVTWDGAVNFCRKLGQQEGKSYRLPTEAEWEYACRAGTTTQYGFGDDVSALGEYAWYNKNAKSTHPVGGKRANGWGLYDMHGNVREWCADWHAPGYYAVSPAEDPIGPDSGTTRVLRGGAWTDRPVVLRSGFRDCVKPVTRRSVSGFRAARTE